MLHHLVIDNQHLQYECLQFNHMFVIVNSALSQSYCCIRKVVYCTYFKRITYQLEVRKWKNFIIRKKLKTFGLQVCVVSTQQLAQVCFLQHQCFEHMITHAIAFCSSN